VTGDAPTPPGRLPDFFVIGHPKCGTTALYEMLKGHPQIFLPAQKEPQFFAADLWDASRTDLVRAGPHTIDEYLALFAAAAPGQLAGDASTRHIWSPTAAQRIAAVRPDARIIALLREPASFLRSLHLQLLQNRAEDEPSLRRALELEAERREGCSLTARGAAQPMLLLYRERARYLEQLQRYHAVFPRENVLVLIYEEFRADNEGTLRQVQRFLGVDDTLPFEPAEVNATVRRLVGLDESMFALAQGSGGLAGAARGAVKLVTPRRLRRTAFRRLRRDLVMAAPEPTDERLMAELRDSFAPDVAALSQYLGRDLGALWGYGESS
jgi:hypothetical protein